MDRQGILRGIARKRFSKEEDSDKIEMIEWTEIIADHKEDETPRVMDGGELLVSTMSVVGVGNLVILRTSVISLTIDHQDKPVSLMSAIDVENPVISLPSAVSLMIDCKA